ncbi:hypothetical protein B4916_16250 [Yersinia intermedia]|nr:hypothetical protein B4916_16250 [Yersinia intermedia]
MFKKTLAVSVLALGLTSFAGIAADAATMHETAAAQHEVAAKHHKAAAKHHKAGKVVEAKKEAGVAQEASTAAHEKLRLRLPKVPSNR